MFRILGFVFILGAVGAVVGEFMGLKLPTVSWGFELSRNVEFFRFQTEGGSSFGGLMYSLAQWLNERVGLSNANGLLWFGWLTAAMALWFGVYLLKTFWRPESLTPLTQRRLDRFKQIRRGYYSFLALIGLMVLASFDQVLVGSEAIMVRYEGKTYWPALTQKIEKGEDFGVEGDLAKAAPKYRELKSASRKKVRPTRSSCRCGPTAPPTTTSRRWPPSWRPGTTWYTSLPRPCAPAWERGFMISAIPSRFTFSTSFATGSKPGRPLVGTAIAIGSTVRLTRRERWWRDRRVGAGGIPRGFLKATPETLYNVDRPPSSPSHGHRAAPPAGH